MAKSGKPSPFQRLQQSVAVKSAAVGSMHRAPTTLNVDFSTIPDPSRTYYAQECWTEFDKRIVGIFFAQKKRTGGPLRSLVCIHMAPMYVANWLNSIEKINSPSIAEIAKLLEIMPEQLNLIPDEAEQTFESSANVVKTGMSGLDATLDFIKFSPFSISNAKDGKLVRGDPQIRIEIRSSLFLALVQNLTEMSKNFPSNPNMGEEK